MSKVVDEMMAVMNGELDDDLLLHYGMPRRSGRYPYGSGEDPYQHDMDFIGRVELLKSKGWTETADNIKKEFGKDMTLQKYRMEKQWANDQRKLYDIATAKRLRDKEGLGPTEIGRKLGMNESSVRLLLNEKTEARVKKSRETADFLKKQVDEKGMIDVGTGVEKELGISKEKLNTALFILGKEGYPTYKGGIPQATNPGQQTNQQVLCPPGTRHGEIYHYDKVNTINEYTSHDDGKTFTKFQYPKSMDSKRLAIRYAEDGGIEKDGIIELRRGVSDLSLGDAKYSQVRILVDNSRYLKGMAIYSDNMPDGVDVIFNTNKKKDVPKMEVLKEIKDDPDNPFGSLIKPNGQSTYIDKNGKEQLSLINKRADAGDWEDWKDALPSQFLGKQSLSMAKKQLGIAKTDKQAEFEDICALTNPTVKKHFLNKFADACDKAAVDLKGAALPGQKYHVIIPLPTLKDNEVYAPNYEDGTKLALIRYPHGGTFEIPIVKVNNKNQVANKLIGKDSIDAICINSKVAERLSGADFDGDTVMCIPTHDKAGKVKVTSTRPLEDLVGFDPKLEYPERPGMKYMVKTDNEMGVISNLITDMTLAGAPPDKLARAVKHSMVVIDAEKHYLDYKQSEIDNNITALKKEYQRHADDDGYGGASTLLSRSKGVQYIPKRQGQPNINQKGKDWYDPSKPEGALIYKNADDLYKPVRKYDNKTHIMELTTTDGKKIQYDVTDTKATAKYAPAQMVTKENGEVVFTNQTGDIAYKSKMREQTTTQMANTDDARTLISAAHHPMEVLYADYANYMKALANKARKEMVYTERLAYDPNAKKIYKGEVESLDNKLKTAELNAVRERVAQRRANVEVESKVAMDPNMKLKDQKKIAQQAITKYRADVGSVSRRDRNIHITDREWEAIQAGAISEAKLIRILNNTDIDVLRERSMPKTTKTLTNSQIARIKAMSDTYTLSQLADKFNVSTSTISKYLKGA